MEENVYQGRFVRVTEEIIDGAVYERVYMRHSVTIFPFDPEGRLIVIQEKRVHETPRIRWKPVTGFWEEGFDLVENVNRELQEEVGKKAGVIQPYFEISSTGSFNIIQRFAVAWDLADSKIPNPDGEDTIVSIKHLDLEEVLQRTLSGELSKGSVGYGLMRLYHDIRRGNLSIPGASA